MPRNIGEGEVSEGEFIDPKTGSTWQFLSRMDSLPEKGQLEPILMALFIEEIPCGIPPLCFKGAMWSVIPRKYILPPILGHGPRIGLRWRFLGRQGSSQQDRQ